LTVDRNAPPNAPYVAAESRATTESPRRAVPSPKRLVDLSLSVVLIVTLSPLMVFLAMAIVLDSRGPAFYRCRRVGRRGREFTMLKFRKMREDAAGPALTTSRDERLTRLGCFLARTKLDELPQLWNVLRGDMSLVGPRPEDPAFVALDPTGFSQVLRMRPGITGLSQLAFAKESAVLDCADYLHVYTDRLLPQKVRIDQFYAEQRSTGMDLRILAWTAAVVLLRIDVAVDRQTGRLSLRRRPHPSHPLPAIAEDMRT
jgi:lipopolysaccharide/colanic/teichoic acid biosynthesis glycosyltransferase